MIKKITAIAFLLLASCSDQQKQGSDGYKFGQRQYEQSKVTVQVVTYKSKAELQKEADRRKIGVANIAAFSVLYVNDQTVCTIHMVDPSVSYEPEYVGHEFLHCVYGQWHSNNNSFS